jgi:hypothetical protein
MHIGEKALRTTKMWLLLLYIFKTESLQMFFFKIVPREYIMYICAIFYILFVKFVGLINTNY